MKTKLLLFATIGGIEPEGDFDASDQIDKYHFFTNDPNVLTGLLEGIPQGFQKQIGEHSLKLISNSKASVFLAMPFENESELNKLPHSLWHFSRQISYAKTSGTIGENF